MQLKDKRTAQEELYSMLQTMDESSALEVFDRIRKGASAEAIVRFVQEGSLLMELSVVPETRTRFEFPYIASVPPALQQSLYFRSHIYEAVQAADRPTHAAQNNLIARQSNYNMPLSAAEMIDPLLAQTKPSHWTRICSIDSLMRKLLEGYFMYEYPWEFIFHKDYFLEDMISGDTRFCSSLLVNAVLAKACVSGLLHCGFRAH